MFIQLHGLTDFYFSHLFPYLNIIYGRSLPVYRQVCHGARHGKWAAAPGPGARRRGRSTFPPSPFSPTKQLKQQIFPPESGLK
jgi:hypothetical protein